MAVDLALPQTNFFLARQGDEETVDHIEIGGHLDDWIGDWMILTDVLVMGYPYITQLGSHLVAVARQESAVFDKYLPPRHPYIIVSHLARRGFSGGPVLEGAGTLVGVVTESLVPSGQATETGFVAALSVEPLWNLLSEHGIYPGSNTVFLRYLDGDEEAERVLLANVYSDSDRASEAPPPL